MAAQLLERLPANGADLGSAVWTVRDDGWLDDHPLTWAIRGTLVRYGSYSTHACRPILWWVPTCHCLRPRHHEGWALQPSSSSGRPRSMLVCRVTRRLYSQRLSCSPRLVCDCFLQSGARADVHPLGFLGYIQIRPSCRTALSDYCEIVSMLLSTPEANHPVVPRRDIFELVAPTYVAPGHWFLLLMLHVWMRGDRMTGIVPKFLSAFR